MVGVFSHLMLDKKRARLLWMLYSTDGLFCNPEFHFLFMLLVCYK